MPRMRKQARALPAAVRHRPAVRLPRAHDPRAARRRTNDRGARHACVRAPRRMRELPAGAQDERAAAAAKLPGAGRSAAAAARPRPGASAGSQGSACGGRLIRALADGPAARAGGVRERTVALPQAAAPPRSSQPARRDGRGLAGGTSAQATPAHRHRRPPPPHAGGPRETPRREPRASAAESPRRRAALRCARRHEPSRASSTAQVSAHAREPGGFAFLGVPARDAPLRRTRAGEGHGGRRAGRADAGAAQRDETRAAEGRSARDGNSLAARGRSRS